MGVDYFEISLKPISFFYADPVFLHFGPESILPAGLNIGERQVNVVRQQR
jgi:hypothetical protein